MRSKKLLHCIIKVVIFVLIFAAVGTFFSMTGVWKEKLVTPSFQPPDFVFPIAWTIIYVLTAISAIIICNSGDPNKKKTLVFYIINGILNVLWTYLFFNRLMITAAFFELILLFISIMLMMKYSYKISKTASFLLLPYFCWSAFALVLNYCIVMLN